MSFFTLISGFFHSSYYSQPFFTTMASIRNLVDAMNLMSLEDEKEGGLDIVIGEEENIADAHNNIKC